MSSLPGVSSLPVYPTDFGFASFCNHVSWFLKISIWIYPNGTIFQRTPTNMVLIYKYNTKLESIIYGTHWNQKVVAQGNSSKNLSKKVKNPNEENYKVLLKDTEMDFKKRQRIRWCKITKILICLKSIKFYVIPIRKSAFGGYGNRSINSKVHVKKQIITRSDEIPLKRWVTSEECGTKIKSDEQISS